MKNLTKIILILVFVSQTAKAQFQSVTLTANCSTKSLTAASQWNPGTVSDGLFAIVPSSIKGLRRLSDDSYIIIGPWERARFLFGFRNAQENGSSNPFGSVLKYFWSWSTTFSWNNLNIAEGVAFDVNVIQLYPDTKYPVRNIAGQFIGHLPVGWVPGGSCIGISQYQSNECQSGRFDFFGGVNSNVAFLGQAKVDFYLDDQPNASGFSIGNIQPILGHTFEYGQVINLKKQHLNLHRQRNQIFRSDIHYFDIG